MVVLGEAGVLINLVLLVYCVLNIVTTPEEQVRNLPKLVWLVLVIVLPLAGGVAWLVAGRPPSRRGGPPGRSSSGRFPEYERPGRAVAQNPDDDEAFLRELRERAQEQRRRAAEQARRLRDEEQPPPA